MFVPILLNTKDLKGSIYNLTFFYIKYLFITLICWGIYLFLPITIQFT